MINPYQIPQTQNPPPTKTGHPASLTRRLVDALLIWFGVLFGAHLGVAIDNGFSIQAAVNRGLVNPMQTLYFFLPVGAFVITTIGCWSLLRFRGPKRYVTWTGIRLIGGIAIACTTYLTVTWINPNGIYVPLCILIVTSLIYVELEAMLCRREEIPSVQAD